MQKELDDVVRSILFVHLRHAFEGALYIERFASSCSLAQTGDRGNVRHYIDFSPAQNAAVSHRDVISLARQGEPGGHL